MKKISRLFAAIISGAIVFASCDSSFVEQPLADGVSVSSTSVLLPGTGTSSEAIEVTSDGDWIIIGGADWFTVDPTCGSGNAVVTITPTQDNVDSYNELNGPRSEKIYIFGKEASAQVTVTQEGESGLDASRMYSKITSADQVESGKGYLIVVNDGTSLQAAKAFAASSETYYSYIYTDKVEESSEGIINRSNASNGYILESKDGGYAIKMPNGRYLFQAASYNNFYSTEDIAKADVWSLNFNADGTVNITNVTVTGKYFQYAISYSSFGAYGSAQDKAALPVLYKDSAAPSTEVLNIASSTKVAAKATTVSIPVTANRTWKVRNHDAWIKSFTKQGTGDGNIVVTFDANEQEVERTATFTVIGETTSFDITLTQEKYSPVSIFNIADVNKAIAAGETEFGVELTDAIVTYVNGGNAFIEDKTGGIQLYQSGHSLKDGDKINGIVTLTGKMYNGYAEATKIVLGDATVTSGATIPCTTLTLADLLKNYEKYQNMRVRIQNVTVTDALGTGDRNGKIKQGEEEIAIYAQVKDKVVMEEGAEGTLICYPTRYKENLQLGVWQTSDFMTAASIASIADVNAQIMGGATTFTATLTDAVVTYVNGVNAFIEDKTGGIQLYKSNHGLKPGQKISGKVNVTGKIYAGYAEATGLDLSAATVTEGAEIPCTTLTLEALLADYVKYQNMMVKLEGVTVTDGLSGSDRDGMCTQGSAEIALRAQLKDVITIANGVKCDLITLPTQYNGKYQLGLWTMDHVTIK